MRKYFTDDTRSMEKLMGKHFIDNALAADADETTFTEVDTATMAGDQDSFNIDLMNKVTGLTYPQVTVYGKNTLDQVLKEYAADLGVNPNDEKILYENKRTGASTADKSAPLKSLGLKEGDVLAIQEAFEIDLINPVTGSTYYRAAVYPENTMIQIIHEYASDLGLFDNDNSRCYLFKTRRNGACSYDKDASVKSLGLQAGDVLAICNNCHGIA